MLLQFNLVHKEDKLDLVWDFVKCFVNEPRNVLSRYIYAY